MLTDDENIIDIQFAVQYFLSDPADYLFNNRMPDENVRQAAETAFEKWLEKTRWTTCCMRARASGCGSDQVDAGNSGSL